MLFLSYLYQKPILRRGTLRSKAYISSLCTCCDDSFSTIWEPYLNIFDVSLSRDMKTLNWLYFSSARLNKRVVIQCYRSRDKTLAGYMVFDVQRVKSSDEGSMYLIDMCVENNDPNILASLTSFAIEIGKQNDAAMLVLWANGPVTDTYFRNTFTLRRSARHYRYIRISDNPDMRLILLNHSNVCPTMIFPPQ